MAEKANDIEEFINILNAQGKAIIKNNVIRLSRDRLHSYADGFCVKLDCEAILTPKTRIYLLDMENGIASVSKTYITGCNIFSPATKQFMKVELVKLVELGYAVYNNYYTSNEFLRFSIDTKIIPDNTEFRMMDFYYIGDKP